jgi:hypothetical protein
MIAYAQPAHTVRLRGTIENVNGNSLSLKGTDGAAVRLTLTNDVLVVAVVKASMGDIKENTFLGSAAMPQTDGTQRALEVHIFPEQMRGTGEGHRPYPAVPNSTMTNGTALGATVTGVDGSTITVKYKDGEKKIVVPPEAPIVTFVPGDRSLLKPGTGVFLSATPQADGKLMASRITAGKDGVVPPM